MKRTDFRFTIAGLLLVMVVCAVMAAAGSFLWQAQHTGADALIIFFPFILIAPMALMILVSLLRAGAHLGESPATPDDQKTFR